MGRSLVLVPVLLLASACSHTFYQFHISAEEQAAIMNARGGLVVAAQGDVNALNAVADLNGRRAVETLLAGTTMESTEADEQHRRLTRALYMGVMANGEDPLAAINFDTATIAARFAARIAQSTAESFGLGGIAQMVGAAMGVADDDGNRLREMQASLVQGRIETCRELLPIISYDAGILGHIHSQIADGDPIYVEWRGRVRAIHLVRFRCGDGHVVMLFTHNRGEGDARAIGWHFLNDAQWRALEPELRRALDLPQ